MKTYVHTKFNVPACNGSLLTAVTWKAKYTFHVILDSTDMILIKVVYF